MEIEVKGLMMMADDEKYTVFVENTDSEILISVSRRYLRIGKGKNW